MEIITMRRFVLALLFLCSPLLYGQDAATRIDKLMQEYFDNGSFIGSVIVAENGKVVYAKGFGSADAENALANGPDVAYHIASITKTFTASMIFKLIEAGKIKLQDPITAYLPDYRKDTGDRVTIHHLLTHSSGIPSYTNADGFQQRVLQPAPAIATFVHDYCSGDLQFEPGSKYAYNNSGFVILGAIIEKVTGMTYEQALHTMILDPAGMTASGLDTKDAKIAKRAKGYEILFGDQKQKAATWDMSWGFSAGGIYATPEDMVKYDQALSDGKIVSKASLAKMIYPNIATTRPGFSYGYGWTLSRRVRTKEGDSLLVMFHEGGMPGFNSMFSRVPARKQLVFVANNSSQGPLLEMTQGVFDILNGVTPAPAKRSVAQVMYSIVAKDGLVAGLKFYETARKDPAHYVLDENELNRLGYDYLGKKQLEDAEAVFALNIESFPLSYNVYDSMGECYATKGDKAKAVKYYRRSVELNPDNKSGIEALKTLGETVSTH
jgi:CubicO group peptidase (beta-lactamase class C family)